MNFDKLIDRNGTGACKWDRRTDEEKRLGIVPMSVADMEFECAPCIREAVVKAAESGIYGYTDPEDTYYDAVTGWMKKRHGLTITKQNISCFYGVVPAISVCVRCFSRPGDGVIVMTPVYYPFREMIECNGRVTVECPLVPDENGRYTIDFDLFEKLCASEKNSLLLFCSPHNPVGRVWTREELTHVHEICARHNVRVVSDEIHFDLVLKGKHTPFALVDEKAILLTSPSKSFNLPGLQLANIISYDLEALKLFNAQKNADGYSNISFFGRQATIAAYNGSEEWLEEALSYIRGNFEALKAFFNEHFPSFTVTPLEGTYLAWVDFRPLGLSCAELQKLTREKSKLFLDEGYIFGPMGEGFERFNIALPREILLSQLNKLLLSAKEC